MEKENKLITELGQSILDTNKLVKANSESLLANAFRQTDIFEAQTNLYRTMLLLIAVNLIIGLGILITTFITYSDKQEIATLHTQLRDKDQQIQLLQTKAGTPTGNDHASAKTDTSK